MYNTREDVFVVKPGASIPMDKNAGDAVLSATLKQSCYLRCEAAHVGEETTVSQIIQK